eukprot:1002473-Amorphochlora_amoeboformis.AAC.3
MSRYRVKYPEYRGILCFRDLKIGLVNSTKTRTMIYAVSDPYYQSFLNNGKGKKNSNQSKDKKQQRPKRKMQNAPKAAPLAQSA